MLTFAYRNATRAISPAIPGSQAGSVPANRGVQHDQRRAARLFDLGLHAGRNGEVVVVRDVISLSVSPPGHAWIRGLARQTAV